MLKRIIAALICVVFVFNNLQYVHAQDFSVNQLPVPGTMVGISAPFAPLALKGLIVDPHKPLEFQFIVDTGRGPKDAASVKDQADQLVKYFLAGLTIPEGDLWVNLSPYEKDRMVPEALGQTNLGRDLLAQDYILKQLTASLIFPEKDLGKKFWSRVYAKAQQQFGTTNVPVNTFNKVWILPDQAQVYENGNAAYVTKATLKVMLDEDYLATQKHTIIPNYMTAVGANIVREIILPEITKEVNSGKNFAPLRQIYQAMILAKWYKETIQNGLLDTVYTNKNKVAGVNLADPAIKEQIYNRYLQAYKKGVFSFIKESPTPDGQIVPRKYFSGGTEMKIKKLDRSGRQADVKSDGAMLSLTVALLTKSIAAAGSITPPLLVSMESLRESREVLADISELFHGPYLIVLLAASPVALVTLSYIFAQFYFNFTLSGNIHAVMIGGHTRRDINKHYNYLLKRNSRRLRGMLWEKLKDSSYNNKDLVQPGYARAALLLGQLGDGRGLQWLEEQQKKMEPIIRTDDGELQSSYAGNEGFWVENWQDHKNPHLIKVNEAIKILKGNKAMLVTPTQVKNDKAALADNGGIDFNQINIKRAGKTVEVQFDQDQLSELEEDGFTGFTPVITSITRISNPFELLGVVNH